MKADNPWYRADNPWYHAHAASREYITPEDISASRDNGAVAVVLCHTVLDAIARKLCEDPSACAFVAIR